jgi:hypothetical protein
MPFFPRILVHFVGLGGVIRQRRAVGGGGCTGLDCMSQPEQMLAADADLAGELRGRHPLGDTAEDQEDLCGAEMSPWPGRVSVHVEDAAAFLAAVIDDRSVGMAAVNVEAIASTTPGAGVAVGVEQIEELLSAPLLVHQIDDWEVHEVSSEEMTTIKPEGQENRSGHG